MKRQRSKNITKNVTKFNFVVFGLTIRILQHKKKRASDHGNKLILMIS